VAGNQYRAYSLFEIDGTSMVDEVVKTLILFDFVIPAKAGIQ